LPYWDSNVSNCFLHDEEWCSDVDTE